MRNFISSSAYIGLILLILTTTSFIIIPWFSGYELGTGIHGLYLPAVFKLMEPGLYEGDFLSTFNQAALSLWAPAVTTLINLSGFTRLRLVQPDFFESGFTKLGFVQPDSLESGLSLPIVFVLAEFIFRFIFLYGIYRLLRHLTGTAHFSLYATIFFIPLVSQYHAFTPISVAQPLAILALAFLFERRLMAAGFLLALGLLIHPITVISFLAVFYLVLGLELKRRQLAGRSLMGAGLLPILALGAHLQWVAGSSVLGLRTILDPAWREIVMLRSGLFVNLITMLSHPIQTYSHSVTLAFWLIVLSSGWLLIRHQIKNQDRSILACLVIIPLVLSFGQFILVDIFNLAFVAALQLGRAFFLWQVLTLAAVVVIYREIYLRGGPDRLLLVALGGTLATLTLLTPIMYHFMAGFVFLPCLLYASYRNHLDPHGLLKKRFGLVLLGSLFLTALVVSVWKQHFEVAVFVAAIMTGVIMAPRILIGLVNNKKRSELALGLTPIVLLILIFWSIMIGRLTISPVYAHKPELEAACRWMERQLPPDSLFITEPFITTAYDPVRLACRRSVLVTALDGDQAILNRGYALEWYQRMNLLGRLGANQEALPNLAKKYRVTHIFSDYRLGLDYPIIFSNGSYFIYAITK